MGTTRIAGVLEKRLGIAAIDDPAIVRLYSREPSGLEGRGVAVVFPESVEDLSKIARYAYKNEVPIYPQGSSSDLVGGAVPDREGLIISFERMNRILGISLGDTLVDVEPGVRLGDLNVELAEKGYMFPVDPGSVSIATVGGAINSGAGGLRGAKYGVMRDWVLGLTIVLPDSEGSILRIGCRTLKCRQGYDLVRLIIGSEGTLALVGEATLRITPVPENVVTGLGFYRSLEDLAETVVRIKESGVQPLVMEFMDERTASIAARVVGSRIPVEGHMLLVGVDVNHEATDRYAEWLRKVMTEMGAGSVYIARTSREAEEMKLYEIRRNLFPAQLAKALETRRGTSRIIAYMEDISVPPTKVPDAVRLLRELEERVGLEMFLGGHIGDGNLHPAVAYTADQEGIGERVEEWHMEVMRIALKLGGTVSSEHGIGLLKKKGLEMEMELLGSLKAIELMRGIKRIFDPKGILNPGKVVDPE
ncbi:MAG: FAD-binding protein [Desulfurococcales archaeon]|nr:FAD-binding protein [Desulfurococcales archaeon]